MQEIIKRILEGSFDYENGSLEFSCTKIEISLSKGNTYEGSFNITVTSDGYTNGYVTTSDIRMECLTPKFVGNDVEISFCFHGESMEEGDVLKGTFSIVSNRGEYYLPFVVSVEHTVLNSSMGTIKNLFHFANLAKTNWKEAVKLFYSEEFSRVFYGSDASLYDCYRALSAYAGNEQNMEEFLIQINKKQRMEFLTKKDSLSLDLPVVEHSYNVTETEIEILKNGWGYTVLQIECEGNFLFAEKVILTDDDFLGNCCKLPIYIDGSLCRRGQNFGKVYLYNSYISIEVPVMVKLGESNPGKQVALTRKKILVDLMKLYQNFRLKKINRNAWMKETDKLVVRLVSMDEEDVAARLFQAQVLITQERIHEAGWILDHASKLLEQEQLGDSVLWAYYLYLTTLIQPEEGHIDWVASEVELIYKKNRNEWRVAWLLLYLSEDYSKSAAAKWAFLERQFQYHCTSPILYIEGLLLLNSNPSVLRRLEGFGLQVLYYGAKRQLLNEELIEQLLYLSGKVRDYSAILEKILVLLYERKQDVRILQEVCTLLINGGKVGEEYLPWYEKGVLAQLRITNLYEHYMLSIDMNKIQNLPKIVLMYFLYQSNLNYERTAFLYHYIQQHQLEYDELYDQYRPKIERFVVEQIQKGHINRHLAGLYQQVLSPDIITEQMAEQLAKILFAHQVSIEDSRLHKVIVYQQGNKIPSVYQLQDKQAFVVLYGNDNVLVFEDSYGNRFMKGVEYTLEKLMMPGKYLKLLAHYVEDCHGLDVYMCEDERGNEELSQDSVARYRRLAGSDDSSLFIKRKSYMKLLDYYYSTDDMKGLEEYLEILPLDILSVKERAEAVRYMVLAGKNEAVYQCLTEYTPYFIDAKILLRFADEMIRKMEFVRDELLLAIAFYTFKKEKYNSVLLEYLAKHFRGLIREMRDIWKAARGFEGDCYELSERMLVQMLYSGAYIGEKIEVLRYYISQGAKTEVEQAVLTQCSYEFFVKEKLYEEYVFQEIYQVSTRGEEVQGVVKLAFLKYYAENQEQMTVRMKPIVQCFLQEMLAKKVYLNFFREYVDFKEMLQEMKKRVIVEYRSASGGRAKIHYVLLHDNGEAEEYTSQYMQEVYPGVFFVDFILFFGEVLQYYIMEESAGEEQLTESGSIQKSDNVCESEGTKYEMINDMIISKTLEDYDTLDVLLEEYNCKQYLNEQLFHLQ